MMCVDCGKLRHPGPCEDEPYDNEPDFITQLEMAEAFHQLEAERLAKQKEAWNEPAR